MTEEQKNMVLEHQGLIGYFLKKYHNTQNYYDLASVGMIGLCKGVKSFDPSKKVKPSTYLFLCIKNEIWYYFRNMDNRELNTSYDLTFENSNGDIYQIYHNLKKMPSAEEEFERIDQINNLYQAILKLPKNEQFIIFHNFGVFGYEKYTQIELAKHFNLSQAQISRNRKKILLKLKEELS